MTLRAPKDAARARTLPSVLGLVATLLAATACTSGSGEPATASPAAFSGSGLAHAKAEAGVFEEPTTTFPVRTQKLGSIAPLHGKTVFYVPISQHAPQFATTAAALKQALGVAGLSLQVCDGNSNPSQVAACIERAAGARAGAIVTDSIPYAMAVNPLVAAQAKNIPILITDQAPDPAHPSTALLGYLPGPGATQLTALADWIIADSGGKARVLINMSTDSPSTLAYVAAAQAEFSDFCPGCTVAVNKISSAGFSRIAASTRSALVNHPGIDYVISEFEQYLQPTIGGIQQSGQAARIKLASSAAQLDGLRMLKAPGLLDADAGQASAYQGWADADAALRLMLKQPVQYTTIPIRLFTRTNVSDLALTPGAEESGAWFGSTGYVREYERLWGWADRPWC